MVATRPIPPGEHVPTADQRILLRASWQTFEVHQALRGDKSSPRMHYLDGVLELMSPSSGHERIAQLIGRLVEVFAEQHGIDLMPYGSWTQKSATKEAGAEPDACYIIGRDQTKARPDLVIEVIWTSGGIDKLEIYKRLKISEAWFWENEKLMLYRLEAEGYKPVAQSAYFPGLDFELLCSFLDRETLGDAKRDYLAALRAR